MPTRTAARPQCGSPWWLTVGSVLDAPVVVIECAAFRCRFRAPFAQDTLPAPLHEYVDAGYRPVAILDRASTDGCSTSELDAAALVAEAAGLEALLASHGLLLDRQPPEGGPRVRDDELVELAERPGAPTSLVADSIGTVALEDWTRAATDDARGDGLTSVPTVLVHGGPLAERTVPRLRDAVRAAEAGA